MAQVAYSRTAYRVAAPERAVLLPRVADPATPYDAVVRTRAPYPSAMRRARRRTRLTALISLTAMTLAGWAVLVQPHGPAPAGDPRSLTADAVPTSALRPALRAALATAQVAEPPPSLAWMLDRSPALGSGAATAFGGAAPAAETFQVAVAEPSASVREIARQVAGAELARAEQAKIALAKIAPSNAAEPVKIAESVKASEPAPARLRVAAAEPTPAALAPAPAAVRVPLPMARPPELRRTATGPAARMAARALPRTRDVFRAAMAEEPSFFETLFGVGAAASRQDGRQDGRQDSRQALAYASPDALPQEAPGPGSARRPNPWPGRRSTTSAHTA